MVPQSARGVVVPRWRSRARQRVCRCSLTARSGCVTLSADGVVQAGAVDTSWTQTGRSYS